MAYILFGDLLRAGRAMLGVTQDELAEEAGVERRALARLETASHKHVNTEVSEKVRRALERFGIEFSQATDAHGEGLRWKSPNGPSDAFLEKFRKKTSV